MAVFTLKALLDMVAGMLPELQVHFRAGVGGTLTDVDLEKLHGIKDPTLAARHVEELAAFSRSLKEFAQKKKIAWTVPTLPPNTANKDFRIRIALNAIGYLIAFVSLQARDRVERVAHAENAALRHQNGSKPPP